MTGGDTIAARFMYREHFEYVPQFKLFFAANHLPEVHHHDDGLWRRIVRIEFPESVEANARDPQVKTLLRDPSRDGAAVLAWAVQGCLEWQHVGLRVPEPVAAATKGYREQMDVMGQWLDEECDLTPDAIDDAALVWGRYCDWMKRSQLEPISRQAFAERLRQEGCSQLRGTGGVRRWRGIGTIGWHSREMFTQMNRSRSSGIAPIG